MSRNYIRKLRLVVAGVKIELSGYEDARDDPGLRVRFQIKDSTRQSPRIADIRISNLSDATAQKIKQEGTEVELLAGYRDNFGRIFKGEIKQKRIGRENPTDTYVDISAATGDRAYNNAVVNKTLKAGSTGKDVYDTLIQSMSQFGIKAGQTPEALAKIKYPSPVVLYGMVRERMRSLAFSANSTWNIRDDNLDMIEKGGARQGAATVLNSRTGLIGMPVQTEMGIIARCLINPRIGINDLVQIDQKSIQQAAYNLSYGGAPFNSEPYLASIAADGIYRVVALDHIGDTHAQPWYCELSCIARGGAITSGQASLGRGGESGSILPGGFLGNN